MGETFEWNYPGLNWSHFHSLANLLSLRNGGQAEPSSLSDTVLEEEWDPNDNGDEDAPSLVTRFAHQISDSGHGRLKRKFLDCLAEFAANKRCGPAVTYSALKEAEDSVTIWTARNEGFSDADKLMFVKFGKMLDSLSCNNGTVLFTILSVHTELILLFQPNKLDLLCGRRWSCIIKTGLKTTIFIN